MSSIANEEKIIQQRLLFKEIQLKKFLNKYMEFLSSYEKLDLPDLENIAKDTLNELELLDFQIHKAEMNYFSRERDLSHHINLCEKIDVGINNTHQEIEDLKAELTVREKKKRAKYEYEVIAGEINRLENPDIVKSKLDKIQQDIDDLKAKRDEQMQKIQNKECQLYQLINAINEFQDITSREDQQFI